MSYQLKLLADMSDIGEPGQLPADLIGLADESLADLNWVGEPLDAIYGGKGYFPVEVEPPPPPRRLIPKSTVQERVNNVGKLGAVFTALNSQPLYFARWFAPDWPNVYFDDEGLLTILAAVGCTEDQIATITAP